MGHVKQMLSDWRKPMDDLCSGTGFRIVDEADMKALGEPKPRIDEGSVDSLYSLAFWVRDIPPYDSIVY